MSTPTPMRNRINLLTQAGQGNVETHTLRYDGQQEITDPNDLIHAGYVAGMKDQLAELLPPDAESLHNKALVMAGTLKKNGYLSTDAAAAYEASKPAGTLVDYIINDPTFTLATPNTAMAVNQGDKGKFELWVNGTKTDEFDLQSRFQEANRSTAQTGLPANSPNGKITVTSIAKYAISLWQKVNAYLTIAAADLRPGYNEITLKHTGTTGGDQLATSYKVFYDVANSTPTVTELDVELQTITPKWLSGVKYAGAGTTILVDAVGNALFDNTYVADPITLSGLHGAPTTTITPTDSAVTGLSNPPAIGQSMQVTNKVLTLNVAGQATLDARVTATPKDPHGTYPASISASKNILVNTFGSDDSGTSITFNSESRRLPLSWDVSVNPVGTANFDSNASIVGTKELEVGITANNENGLMYPSRDYTQYLPANTQNLSAETGEKMALFFLTSPESKSNIQLVFNGLSGGLGSEVITEIRLGNNQTGWLRLDQPYDSGLGVDADGRGCMIGAVLVAGGNTTVNATFGGKNTFAAGMTLFLRFRYPAKNSRVVNRVVSNW